MGDYVKDWKTSVHEMAGVIKIEHSYWGQWGNGSSSGGYVRGVIKFLNTSEIPMEDVKVYLDLDDTAATWDVVIVDQNGQIIPEGLVDLGSVAPGKFVEKKYWWSIRHLFGPTQENFEVKFNIIPELKMAFTKAEAFTDTATVSTV